MPQENYHYYQNISCHATSEIPLNYPIPHGKPTTPPVSPKNRPVSPAEAAMFRRLKRAGAGERCQAMQTGHLRCRRLVLPSLGRQEKFRESGLEK